MDDDVAALDRKKRRLLIGIVAVVLLIGIVGVAVALLSGSSDDQPGGTAGTTGTTVASGCRGDRIVTYRVQSDAGAGTAAEAAKSWKHSGEVSTTTTVDEVTSTVALAKTGEDPRAVLTVTQGGSGWTVTGTAACLYEEKGATACPAAPLTVDAKAYLPRRAGTSVLPGAVVGQGTLTPCLKDHGKVFTSRGAVGPVTAFRGRTATTVVVDLGGGSLAVYATN